MQGSTSATLAAAERALRLCPLEPLRPYAPCVLALAGLAEGDAALALQHAGQAVASEPALVPAVCAQAAACIAAGRDEQASSAGLLAAHPEVRVARFPARTVAREDVARRWGAGRTAAGLPAN